MAKCANCEKDASYLVNNPGALAQVYCDTDLPKIFNKNSLPFHVVEIPLNYGTDTDAEELRIKEKPKKARPTKQVSDVVLDDVKLLEEKVEETAEWI